MRRFIKYQSLNMRAASGTMIQILLNLQIGLRRI
jgi:hypothetical protein